MLRHLAADLGGLHAQDDVYFNSGKSAKIFDNFTLINQKTSGTALTVFGWKFHFFSELLPFEFLVFHTNFLLFFLKFFVQISKL